MRLRASSRLILPSLFVSIRCRIESTICSGVIMPGRGGLSFGFGAAGLSGLFGSSAPAQQANMIATNSVRIGEPRIVVEAVRLVYGDFVASYQTFQSLIALSR